MACLLDHGEDSLAAPRTQAVSCALALMGCVLGLAFLAASDYVCGLAAVFGPGVFGVWSVYSEPRRGRRSLGPRRAVVLPQEERLAVERSRLLVGAGQAPSGPHSLSRFAAAPLLSAALALSLAALLAPAAGFAVVPVALLLLARALERRGRSRIELRERGLVLDGLSPALRPRRVVARYAHVEVVEIARVGRRWLLVLWLADYGRFCLKVRGQEVIDLYRRVLRERLVA